MLTLFRWLDQNSWSYWAISGVPTILLVICLVRTLRARDGLGPLEPRRVDWRYALLMLVVLFAWRWPWLYEPMDLNPDESWFLAGALTLRHDPVFWRSVDGITSGPLNFFALLPPSLAGLPLNYFVARLTVLAMVFGATVALYATLRSAYGTRVARVAILPALLFFALAADSDFVCYASENPSLLFAGVGLWLLWSQRPRPDDAPGAVRWRWLAGGAIVGLMPWAKLQSAPLALTLAAWGAWLALASSSRALSESDKNPIVRTLDPVGPLRGTERLRVLPGLEGPRHPIGARWVQVGKLAAATLAPSLVFLILVAWAGVFEDFYRSYLLDNFTYVEEGGGYAKTAARFVLISQFTRHYAVFFVGVVGVGIVALIERGIRRRAPGPITWMSLVLSLVSFWVVLAPGRDFLHYLLYTVLPLTAWAGASYGDMTTALERPRARLVLALAFMAVTAVPMWFVRATYIGAPAIYGHFAEHWLAPYDSVGKVLLQYRRDGDTMGLWGWYSHAYVQARLPQAQREAESEHQLRDWPLRDSYFRPQYMKDLRRNRPALFVDAVGPGAFGYDVRETSAHETFGELAAYIRENYTLAADEGHARVYVRNDRYAEIGAARR
jgi:hypothetical protein